jgi:hypothetical protein
MIPQRQLRVIAKAGHYYAAMGQPAEFGRLLRTFFDAQRQD